MDAKYFQRNSYPQPKKKTHMSFHRESSCLQGGENPPRLSLLQKFKKDTLALSLLLFSLCTSNLYLSLPKHFLANPPPAHVTSFSSLLVPLHHKPLSLSLYFFLKNPSRAAKKQSYLKNNSCEKPMMISYMIPKKNHTVYVLNIMYLFPMFVFN